MRSTSPSAASAADCMPDSVSASAWSSVANARAVPRNMWRENWSSRMMRLERRRGPSAQGASCPAAARSWSGPKRRRISASRRCRTGELPSPNQKRSRCLALAADSGWRPNQNSRTLRASSTLFRFRAGAIGIEQLLELLSGFARGGEEFLLVLLDLVLRDERALVVLAEAAHRLARRGGGLAEVFEHRCRHFQTGGVSLADHGADAGVHEREGMLAVARAREDLQVRKLLAHQHRGAHRGVDVFDRQHQHLGALCAGRAQQVEPRGVAVIDLVAEAAHEIDVRLADVERREGQTLDPQHARYDLPEAAEAGDDHRDVVLVDVVE